MITSPTARTAVRLFLLCLPVLCLWSCVESPTGLLIPEFRKGGSLAHTKSLQPEQLERLEGVWAVDNGRGRLGDSVVIKISGDRLTIYARPNAMYVQLESGHLDSVVLFDGYWREQTNSNTGLIHLSIDSNDGAEYIIHGGRQSDTIRLSGSYGQGQLNNTDAIQMHWVRAFSQQARQPFAIIAHRAGGRTADLIPHSENTVELIRIAERFGANAVEIDVRLSVDNVPFLYHDEQLNPRLVRRGALVGPPEDYPIKALQFLVTLINGERIPTLAEALDAIVNETNLEFVYLDIKTENAGLLSRVIPLQLKAMADARAIPNRKPLTLMIGIPTQAVYDEFIAIPEHRSIPSIVELSLEQAQQASARVWAPRWTLGTQLAEVQQAKASGIAAVTWTLDDDAFIQEYLANGEFDGFLTNYPTLVTWHVYMR